MARTVNAGGSGLYFLKASKFFWLQGYLLIYRLICIRWISDNESREEKVKRKGKGEGDGETCFRSGRICAGRVG